jgi:glyoxylase I family protein
MQEGEMSIRIQSGAPLFQVYDMQTSMAFYRDVLGFEVLQTAPDGPVAHWALLRNGETYLMLNTKYELDHERPAVSDTISGHEDVTLYFMCDDPDAAYRELKAKGWADVNEPSTAPYGMRQVYLRDPDGFSLCLQHGVEGG